MNTTVDGQAADPVQPAFSRAGVVGAGAMGTGIAYVLVRSGASVWLVEPDPAQVARSTSTLETLGLDPSVVGTSVQVVSSVVQLPEGLDLVIEAVPERLDLKRAVLGQAWRRAPGLLGTNTSALSIAELARDLPDPSALIGLHFFNPVWAMKLLEVIRTPGTRDDHVARALALAAQLGKEPIVVADAPGFASSRLGLVLGLEAMRMLQDGVASAADIDKAMELGYRHPMGPLRLTDLIGLDVRLDVARNLERSFGARFSPPQILIDHVARGELGRKTGRGFFDWPTP